MVVWIPVLGNTFLALTTFIVPMISMGGCRCLQYLAHACQQFHLSMSPSRFWFLKKQIFRKISKPFETFGRFWK